MTNLNPYAGHIEQDAQNSAQEQRKRSAGKSQLGAVRRLLTTCEKLLGSAGVFFRAGARGVTEAEKAALKESLTILHTHLQKLKEFETRLGGETPEQQQKIIAERQKVNDEFQAVQAMVEQETEAKVVPLQQQEKQIGEELRRLKAEYLQARDTLLEKKKAVALQKKELEAQIGIRRRAAKNARTEALREVRERNTKRVSDPAILLEAEEAMNIIRTDLNRVKGNLRAALPSPQDRKILDAIIRGTFAESTATVPPPASAPRPTLPNPPDAPSSDSQSSV